MPWSAATHGGRRRSNGSLPTYVRTYASHMARAKINAAGRRSFSRRCRSLAREQRARIYILRRCATMLLCWYIRGDD
ncbi:hypothetical protein AXF42_Ash011758 [Apostasia shenzhenica]|uniref:Uncharacterized protein n=1 Tax=Apostasia shenzhenica TaxID=1088818 RepID=A0A2H9ZUW4_9ASPA|nr:hypothetical protein AXF42_Ash011758 [Apostasia shenzhenica]